MLWHSNRASLESRSPRGKLANNHEVISPLFQRDELPKIVKPNGKRQQFIHG